MGDLEPFSLWEPQGFLHLEPVWRQEEGSSPSIALSIGMGLTLCSGGCVRDAVASLPSGAAGGRWVGAGAVLS